MKSFLRSFLAQQFLMKTSRYCHSPDMGGGSGVVGGGGGMLKL